MSDKHWYQDGGTVVIALIVAGFLCFLGFSFYVQHVEETTPVVIPRLSARVQHPVLFGAPTLEMTAWHQHTGNLRNGTFRVRLYGDDLKEHSYEVWEPNKSHAITLSFPLRNYDPEQEIPIEFAIYGNGIKTHQWRDAWVRNNWKSNQK
ncbi:MAG: hypothetical protein JWP89_6877 [Schlesneria sp.]|nr:hypothetical protein [Schlesneria sp.]